MDMGLTRDKGTSEIEKVVMGARINERALDVYTGRD